MVSMFSPIKMVGGQKRKYHLVKWEIICKSKKKGGLGIKDIRKMNLSLLCKWRWKLDTEDAIWQDLVKAKYLRNDTISTVRHKIDDSPIWCDLLKVQFTYRRGRSIKPNNGKKILLWTDLWRDGNRPCTKHNTLFELCCEKNITIHRFIEKEGNLEFRRWLHNILHVQWTDFIDEVLNQHFTDSPDEISWRWTKNGKFSVKCTYEQLTRHDMGNSHTKIWQVKVPYKIKIFLVGCYKEELL